jgi:hypothetical protein
VVDFYFVGNFPQNFAKNSTLQKKSSKMVQMYEEKKDFRTVL